MKRDSSWMLQSLVIQTVAVIFPALVVDYITHFQRTDAIFGSFLFCAIISYLYGVYAHYRSIVRGESNG